MSHLNDLLRQVANTDPQLAKDLRSETDALAERRSFGLNFERHTPEAIELPGRPVRKSDKVRILPERGTMPKKEHERLFRVVKTYTADGVKWADVEAYDDVQHVCSIPVSELVVVAEFRDPIYPGLVSTGKVERGGDKPFHTVINAENYHALQSLLFTHRGKVDAIYIDPPYNTGARDWKYNNDYVEADDHYRHSKWLAMMERRLLLAKELLNPADSVLIVTIDEKEYLRLGLLLAQVFPDANMQMITTSIKPSGSQRSGEFSRVEEFVYFVMLGNARPANSKSDMLHDAGDESQLATVTWQGLRRRGSTDWKRSHRPNGFYPLMISITDGSIHSVGDPLSASQNRFTVTPQEGTWVAWPLDPSGEEGRWQISPERLREQLAEGTAALRSVDKRRGSASVVYLKGGDLAAVRAGDFRVDGLDEEGKLNVLPTELATRRAKSMWLMPSHDASAHGTALLSRFLPGRKFPFPKSLFAVEDALRFFVGGKQTAVVLDFFAGSGTTAHAVMRLNKQDGGKRTSVSITNNEVSAVEQRALRNAAVRPGDAEWEALGICSLITKPRIEAAVTGRTPSGDPVIGNYKFVDEFPMSTGLDESVEFFNLTYESALRVSSGREFARVAPFLWLRAGSRGRRIGDLSAGWDVAEAYGVIANLDLSEPFVDAIKAQVGLTHVFVVTDEDRLFEALVRQLPEHVEPVRLYSSYLRNFEIEAGRAAR